MKITKKQLRRVIREAVSLELLKSLEGRPHTDPAWREAGFDVDNYEDSYQSLPRATSTANSYADTIVSSGEGDTVIVNGEETYIDNVPFYLETLTGFEFSDEEAENLISTLEVQNSRGYVETGITYKNGKWNWT